MTRIAVLIVSMLLFSAGHALADQKKDDAKRKAEDRAFYNYAYRICSMDPDFRFVYINYKKRWYRCVDRERRGRNR
jgi:hypothetical protein